MSELKREEMTGLAPEEIGERFEPLGLPRYRARQVFHWIHRHRAGSFGDMTTLPKELRSKLERHFRVGLPERITRTDRGPDGSRKQLFRLSDGTVVETVEIPGPGGLTACVSSQAGCRYDCAFCATPLGGFSRSLGAGEIAGQVLALEEPVRRIVYMGMGEPLANYRNVVKSVRLLTHPEGYALPPRRITISTVGLVPLIDRLADERLGVRLAVSLTAADGKKRAELMPIEKKFPLDSLVTSAARFAEKSRSRVTFEYVLLAGINDGDEDARALVRLLSPLPCKVNLIPFNRVDSLPFSPPSEERIDRFLSMLTPSLTVTVRRSAGREIDGACGQLRLRSMGGLKKEAER